MQGSQPAAWMAMLILVMTQLLLDERLQSVFANMYRAPQESRGLQLIEETHNTVENDSSNSSFHDECAFARNVTFSNKPPTTTVIVTSNLIPTMPSTAVIEDTLDSLSMLIGLEPNTPIIIAVDGIQPQLDTPESRQRLQDWVSRVRSMFKCHPNVQILTSFVPLHISNTLRMAIQQVTTEFVHIMEHDFPFTKEIDHQLLVRAIRAVPELRIIRFNKRGNHHWKSLVGLAACARNHTYAGMDFHLGKWSNNNHFTTKAYYEWLLEEIGPHHPAPEAKMMTMQNNKNCTYSTWYGQYMYGPVEDGRYLYHIDGKRASYNRTYMFNNHKRCPNATADVPSSVLPWVRCPR